MAHPRSNGQLGWDTNPFDRLGQGIVNGLGIAHITPIAALIAGILILIIPSLLNYIVAFYLIVVGLIGLSDIYHFMS